MRRALAGARTAYRRRAGCLSRTRWPGGTTWRRAPAANIAAHHGGTARLVASDARDLRPVWSPDGARIAFVRQAPGANAAVHVVRADGTGARALTAGTRWIDFAVYWR